MITLIKKLYPDIILNQISDVTIELLKQKNIKAVVADIDNTLVSWDSPLPNQKCIRWLKTLEQNNIKTCLISNNNSQRVQLFNQSLQLFAIHDAKKPRKQSYMTAMEYLNLPPYNIAAVGDQIFTDIYGANRMGFYSILVSPISPKEFKYIRVKRFFEKIVLYWYRKTKYQ